MQLMEPSNTATSTAPQVKIEKGPELSTAPVSPTVNYSEKVEAIPMQNVPAPAQKKGGMGCFAKGCIASCVVLLLCCCVTIVLAVAEPSVFAQMIASGSKGQDQALTRVTSDEIPGLKASSNITPEMVGTDGQTYSITIPEKQFLATLVSGIETEVDPNAFGLDFENKSGKFEVDFSVLAAALKSDPQFSEQISFDPKDVKGVYITIELSNDIEGNLVFENLSLGNTVLDPIVNSFMTPDVKQGLSKSIQEAFFGGATGTSEGEASEMKIKKVEFVKDAIKLTYEMDASFTPETP